MRDSAPLPEEISGVWQIWNQMDKRWIPSEAVRVTAVGNERVAIVGPTPAACSIYADKLGTYRRVKGQEANGHAFYRRSDIDAMLWVANGVWWIGPSASLGRQSGYWRVTDSARVPEAIKGCWEVGDGTTWHRAEGVTCAEHVRSRVVLTGTTPGERHQDKLGAYQLCKGELVNDRVCYQQVGNASRMIWFLTPYWYIGKRDEKALGQGWVQVRSLAPVPELISGVWSVWNSTERKWVEAPDLTLIADESSEDTDGPIRHTPTSDVPKALPIDSESSKEAADGGSLGGGAAAALGAAATATIAAGGGSASAAAAAAGSASQVFVLHEWGVSDAGGRLAHERVGRMNEFLKTNGLASWLCAEGVQGNVLEVTCAAIDESDLVLVVISQRTLDRIAGKHGALDPLKKAFEYAERTKGAEVLLPVVIDPSVRSSRDWWGAVGMVLGSRPITDLSHEAADGQWEASMHGLLDEIALLRGGTAAAAPGMQTADSAPLVAQGTLVDHASADSGGASGMGLERRASGATAADGVGGGKGGLEGLTMAQKAARVREELGLDGSLPIARLVQEANAAMGIEGHGPLAKQVETLMIELGVL